MLTAYLQPSCCISSAMAVAADNSAASWSLSCIPQPVRNNKHNGGTHIVSRQMEVTPDKRAREHDQKRERIGARARDRNRMCWIFTAQRETGATRGASFDFETQRCGLHKLACLDTRPQRLDDTVNVALAAVYPLCHHRLQAGKRCLGVRAVHVSFAECVAHPHVEPAPYGARQAAVFRLLSVRRCQPGPEDMSMYSKHPLRSPACRERGAATATNVPFGTMQNVQVRPNFTSVPMAAST